MTYDVVLKYLKKIKILYFEILIIGEVEKQIKINGKAIINRGINADL
jgi:hypothetical protein